MRNGSVCRDQRHAGSSCQDHSANTAAARPRARVEHTSTAAHSEASVHPELPVQERFKCVEAFFFLVFFFANLQE